MTNPHLTLRNVSVARGTRLAVQDISLSIHRSQWFGIIGANGSGKTTLLRATAGRLPFATGTCTLDNTDITTNREHRARHIGFAPPADTLPDALRVRELLGFVTPDPDTFTRQLGPLGHALGLSDMLDRWIGDCSAGMRQRVALALAFTTDTGTVILDEPFNWLDPVATYDLKHALQARVAQGLTLITALHDLTTLAQCCTGGAMLANGRIVLNLTEHDLSDANHDLRDFEARTIERLRH
ncbi:multidrug ABC transporter ATP-binding protein [Neoasaia chiangmaiensis NBRC 101099]|uniref:ABC transporter n=1 Tax=Neoasaia chiangmaiensis TaxID=320497 RepID=A0A1U9KQ63_9PROT|nr:ABC transporter ATP-binding protein [Neoasaia chiangmaiensis]AQS87981.1 ABC transporter [Neoasaia chiangmaiensis]GBR38912.1 multidrug ABC transporter ATP-binding protein [Neoasaia chiangmaiensis NBRC 101099]GEN15644.1 ABC transporter ATP-binding protein [Neoasaia chiangmaiensis]